MGVPLGPPMGPLKAQVLQIATPRIAHKMGRKGPRQNFVSPGFHETGGSCQLPEMELAR